MLEFMKDRYYNYNTIHELAMRISLIDHTFPADDFITGILDKTIAEYPVGFVDSGLLYFPDFVEVYGQDDRHWDLSMAALERYTQYSTAEFAVRPFIIKHEARMMAQMAAWAEHDNEHARRLASEGCRPALPWGQALISFKNDPLPVLRILEKLKADPSLYVRKSVTNNLNDISKPHPDLIVGLAKDWYGKNEHTDWIVKHGCRILLKKGNRDVLDIFGFADTSSRKHYPGIHSVTLIVNGIERGTSNFEVQL